MISSADVNKYLRKYLSPVLRENGFSVVQARKAWGWHGHCVWVFNVRAVGSYFSDVTGWPPMSVNVWLGVYYDFIPFRGHTPPKRDEKERLRPDEAVCHKRSHLTSTLDQERYKSQLSNPGERARNDLWWIELDGSNKLEVVENIALSFIDQGIHWFNCYDDLDNTFKELENSDACYDTFYKAMHFAKQLEYSDKYKMYAELLEREGRRIGRV